MNTLRMIDVVFAETSEPNEVTFVEVEDENRKGVKVGKWVKRDDGYWVLRFQVASDDESPLIVNTQWRPMETAPKDGTIIEMLCAGGITVFVRWSKFGWVSPREIPRPGVMLSDGYAWRTVHPEWDEHLRPLRLPVKED